MITDDWAVRDHNDMVICRNDAVWRISWTTPDGVDGEDEDWIPCDIENANIAFARQITLHNADAVSLIIYFVTIQRATTALSNWQTFQSG